MERYPKQTLSLECELTPEETKQAGKQLSSVNQRKSALEEEKKANASKYKAQIDECDADISRLSRLVSTECEMRDVECETRFNNPEPMYKSVFRLDTGEKIRTNRMTNDEINDLFINGLGEQTTDEGTVFVFKNKYECSVFDREDPNIEIDGWDKVSGPSSAESLVDIMADKKDTHRVLKGKDSFNNTIYLLQRKLAKGEKPKETPEDDKEKKPKLPKDKKKSTDDSSVNPEPCGKKHPKWDLRCRLPKGHEGECKPKPCAFIHDDGKRICMAEEGHEGMHSFVDRSELI